MNIIDIIIGIIMIMIIIMIIMIIIDITHLPPENLVHHVHFPHLPSPFFPVPCRFWGGYDLEIWNAQENDLQKGNFVEPLVAQKMGRPKNMAVPLLHG